ncbi:MAG: tetratricopeptide repeat protein [Candidatus Eisenbacteria bacterium]|nr:tetratricopeptide repeat protein [Candidatus Latescibacterota bacterium]MBD3301741.1 tetratricopeptide repeat protein [Candidatus Eisenbacteria bacterium]
MRAAASLTTTSILGIALLCGACSDPGTGSVYRAERDHWNAVRLEGTLRLGPETPPTEEETREVLAAYAAFLEEHRLSPRSEASPDSAGARTVGRLRADVTLRMARLLRGLGERDSARALLQRGVSADAPGLDVELALRLELALIDELVAAGAYERAAERSADLPTRFPARSEEGAPIVPVLDAPIQAADLLADLERTEEAMAALGNAEVYYRSLLAEDPDDETAAIAWMNLGTIAVRRGDVEAAAEALERARGVPGAERLQPRILFVLGTLHQEGRGDPEKAAEQFAQVVQQYPESELAGEARVRWAANLADLGRPDSSLGVLDRFDEQHPRDPVNRARADLLGARILTHEGRWQEALARYRKLRVDHPTSPQAIGAPFEVAAEYERLGEEEAARSVLEQALVEYDRIRSARGADPRGRMADEAAVRALGRLGRWETALERLLSFPDRYPGDARAPLVLIEAAGIAENRLDDPERAAEILEGVAERYPNSPIAERARSEAERLRED